MKRKISTWIKRYLPAEILAVIGALLGGLIINVLFRNSVLTALGATWGENIGYYGIIILRDLKKQRHVFKVIRNLILEFGPAEYLDSFLIRPFMMYFFPRILNNLTLGLIAGKFAADFIFYIPTIISYELKNKFIGE